MQRELVTDHAFHVFIEGTPARRVGATTDEGEDGKPRPIAVPARGWFVRPFDLDIGIAELGELIDATIAAEIPGLSLAGCRRIDGAALATIARATQLEYLDLFHTAVGDAGLASLSALPRLRSLSLAGTRVTDAGIGALATLPIEALDLGWTDVGDAGLEKLRASPTLRVLSLRATRISDRGIDGLTALPLRELDLQETAVTDDGVAALRPLAATLEGLMLGYTRITDACIDDLGKLSGLRTLVIRATRVSADRDGMLVGALTRLGANNARGIVR